MKRPTQTYTTLLLRSIVLCAGISQVAQATDLVEVYQKALTGDPQFRQVAANKRAVLEERPQALANLLPEVSLSADIAGISSVRTVSNAIGFDSCR